MTLALSPAERKRRRRLLDAAYKAERDGRNGRAIVHYGQWLGVNRKD